MLSFAELSPGAPHVFCTEDPRTGHRTLGTALAELVEREDHPPRLLFASKDPAAGKFADSTCKYFINPKGSTDLTQTLMEDSRAFFSQKGALPPGVYLMPYLSQDRRTFQFSAISSIFSTPEEKIVQLSCQIFFLINLYDNVLYFRTNSLNYTIGSIATTQGELVCTFSFPSITEIIQVTTSFNLLCCVKKILLAFFGS